MKHEMSKKLVLLSVIGTMVAMVFMASSLIYPHPLLLVLAMSIGQGIALFALVLFLLAVALDLQSGGDIYVPTEEPAAPAEPPPANPGQAPPT
ncbi:MAG TPA: hypothetical protein VFM53_04285 [Anaeromyxobacteraceae bacterium]|nr:hypothetical protein [Anaeromyxobacteraceae bacterium]